MAQTETQKQNLKPVRSKSEARERGRKGGIASGKARNAKKPFKEMAKAVSQTDRDKILEALLKNAERGSIPHMELLLKLMGEHPSQDSELAAADNSISITIDGGDDYAD